MDNKVINVGELFKKRADEFLSEGAAGQAMIKQTYDLLAKSYTKQRDWEKDILVAFPELQGKRWNYEMTAGTITILGDVEAPPEQPQPKEEPDTAEGQPQ